MPPLGADRRGRLSRRLRVRLRGRPCLRLLPGPAQRRDGCAREPLERRGRAASRRGASVHLRAADADARGRCPASRAGDEPRPVVDAGPCRTWPDPRAPVGHEGGLRAAAAGRLRPVRGARPRRPRAPRGGREGRHDGRPAVRRHGDPHLRRGRAAARARRDRLRGRQRAEPLPRLPRQRRADARVADRLGRLSHGRPGLPRRGRPPRLRRAQQGHHPPRRRDGRPGRARAGDHEAPRRA